MNWKPNHAQIQWTQNLIRTMRQGGVWGVPASGCVYAFDHANKTLWLISGDARQDLHRRTVTTFAACGWKVLSRAAGSEEAEGFAESRSGR